MSKLRTKSRRQHRWLWRLFLFMLLTRCVVLVYLVWIPLLPLFSNKMRTTKIYSNYLYNPFQIHLDRIQYILSSAKSLLCAITTADSQGRPLISLKICDVVICGGGWFMLSVLARVNTIPCKTTYLHPLTNTTNTL